jgi:hypothetical protein
MLNVREVLGRVLKLEAYRNMKESDFRQVIFGQTFTPGAGAAAPAQPRQFPAGAIVYGITAGAFVPGAAIGSGRNRQAFQIAMSYNGGEAIIIDGPLLADAVLGGGDADIFPAKELVLLPNQQIVTTITNVTNGSLTVDVAYHSLVYRYAS